MAETKYVGWSSSNSDYVCDGTDDQIQINLALAWAASNPGSTIYLRGPYTYHVTNQVFIGPYTELIGDSTAVIMVPDNACGSSISNCVFPNGKPVITQKAGTIPKSIKIHGFQINGNCQNQSTKLGTAHGKVSSAGSGVERLIGLHGSSSSLASDIKIYNMKGFDSFGEFAHIYYTQNVQIYNNNLSNHQHDAIFLIEVTGDENKVYGNTIAGITDGCLRLDDCKNFEIYKNGFSSYTGDHNNGAAERGENGIQIANESNKTTLTNNIHVYDNTFANGLCGIWINDQLKKAGANSQTVLIEHNDFTGCGWSCGANWASGISIGWGNGITIQKNTFNGCYQEGIQILSAISSSKTHTLTLKNNNIINTLGKRPGSSGSSLSILGYGVYNAVPTKFTVNAAGNYATGNYKGNYYNVTPASASTSYISDATVSGGSSTSDDDPTEETETPVNTGIYIPGSSSIIDDEYYVERDSEDIGAYINKIPFQLMAFSANGEKVIGEQKSPSVAGSNLTDFDFQGGDVTLTCTADDMDEMNKVLAAFYQRGHTVIELGTPNIGYKITGMGKNHKTSFDKTQGDYPELGYPFNLTFKCEKPYKEKIQKRVRGRYIHVPSQFSSDDLYGGNLIKNYSFENWSPNTSLTWSLENSIADNSWEVIRYASRLSQFCALANSGTNNRVMIQNEGESWRLPTGLTATNKNNNWKVLIDCDDWGLWAAFSSSGLAGYACMTSQEGDSWAEKATPSAADSNTWSCGIFIPPQSEPHMILTSNENYIVTTDEHILYTTGSGGFYKGRAVVFASSGTNQVMYSDDQFASFTMAASADETASWISADFSGDLQRVVVVANSGQIMYSDDYCSTFSLVTAPALNYTSVKWADIFSMWIACTEDGDIVTSPTGLSDTWTVQDVPYSSISKILTNGYIVSTDSDESPNGYCYTTKFTDYQKEYTFSIPAMSNGHLYRLDKVFCHMRTLNSKATAYIKCTIQSNTTYPTETELHTWYEKSTSYVLKSYDISRELAANEGFTLRFYIKTTNASYKAVSTLFGYSVSEKTSSGSTITYNKNSLTDLVSADSIGLAVAIAKTGDGNRIIYTVNGVDWKLGTSAANYTWNSICYADDQNKFSACGSSGTGKRIMSLEGYGELKNVSPDGWALDSTGQEQSEEYATDGNYTYKIEGDGVSKEPGGSHITVPLNYIYDSGELYVLSIKCMVTGLTSGSYNADIYSGGKVIKELVFDENTDEPTTKQIKFKFDNVPSLIYARVHGANTPNAGSAGYFDDIIVEKASDFEIAETGSDIITGGYYDVIPDVILKGVSTSDASASTSKIIKDKSDPDEVFESTSKLYGSIPVYSVVLPALTGGSTYTINSLSFKLRSSNSKAYSHIRVTVQAASLYGGKENTILMWKSNYTDNWFSKTHRFPYTIESDTNETVTLRYYIHTTITSEIAYASELGYKITENIDNDSAIDNSIYAYNTADSSRALHCCNSLPQGYISAIKSNYTGYYMYVEPFEDDAYISNAYSISGSVARNTTNNTLVMGTGSSIVFPFDTLYPVTAIPFIRMYVLSGIPKISIADDSGTDGAPGTFYPVDSNTAYSVTNSDVQRELDNITNLRLRGKTKYYVKIEPGASVSCEFGQMLEYASLNTMDAERFFIYSGNDANTIAVVVDGTEKCSAVCELGYHDANILG